MKKISDLSLNLEIPEEFQNNFPHRFHEAVSIMQNNYFLFASVYEHEDIFKNIMDYLNLFGLQLMYDKLYEFQNKDDVMVSLMLTIYNIIKEPNMQLFLENALVKNSAIQHVVHKNKTFLSYRSIEIMLLEGSDLYAFINCLKMKYVTSFLNKIWVQESVNKDFQWHVKKYVGYLHVPVYTFQSQQELLTLQTLHDIEVKILSIWTEDIVSARNLAARLQKHIIFINTHINFCAGILIPYTKLCPPKYQFLPEVQYMNDKKWIINPKSNTIYNLFYDGMWQKPIQNMYWEYNGVLLANATITDYETCFKSATKGFAIWSEKSIDSRMHILSKLGSTLQNKNETLLANEIFRWIKLQYYYKNQIEYQQNNKFEITKIRIPRGVIVLEEKEKVTMFRELTQCLITGNSIIVLCNPDLCTLVQYCDIFSTATIPSGVINLISSDIIEDIKCEKILENMNPHVVYTHLTVAKHIILSLK